MTLVSIRGKMLRNQRFFLFCQEHFLTKQKTPIRAYARSLSRCVFGRLMLRTTSETRAGKSWFRFEFGHMFKINKGFSICVEKVTYADLHSDFFRWFRFFGVNQMGPFGLGERDQI